MTRFRKWLLLLLLTVAGSIRVDAQAATPAIQGIVMAFGRNRVVAIAESHGLKQAGDFYLSLVRDPAFQRVAPDIVIEFASRQSQPLLDAYVLHGDSLSLDILRTIWRNTTKVASWEFPVYARWLAGIREVNRTLPPGRKFRVIAGDTRVDWGRMHTQADWTALGENDLSFSDVIVNDVLARGRKALVVLGSNHLMRTGTRDDGPNTTTRVEAKYPGSMYVAWLYNGRPGGVDADARMIREGWVAPSLVDLRRSWAGEMSVGKHKLRDVADALLYLGASRRLQQEVPPPSDFDFSYRRELDRRSFIEWGDSSRARNFLKLPALPSSGKLVERFVSSGILGRERRVWVYTPAGYPQACTPECLLVLAFDGSLYRDEIPLPSILDSLIWAKELPPTIALLVDDASGSDRLADLANQSRFAGFVGDELIPWLRSGWKVTRDPARTIVTGSSAGGLASAYLAFARPDLFGNVLSQSGAFWRGNAGSNGPPFEWLTSQYRAGPTKPIRFFLDVGSVESAGAMGGTAPSILQANRRLRDVLREKGYAVSYFEVPGGEHDATSWRRRLPIGLVALSRP